MPPSTSLKQRLAALSLSPSSPTSPGSSQAPAQKRKFNPPWSNLNLKRQGDHPTFDGSHRVVQDVMGRLIFQAGVDFETRPIVVLNASALPDPREVNYDLLLSRILAYLNLYVESDYTVVFFAAGGKNTPGWNWVWKAYRSLSRKYRKNLKRLYIVHSSFFSKMLFSLAGAIISPKFFRKLAYINTLSELACHVPLTQIDVPPAVYQENLKHEKSITLPVPTRSNIFGVPLEDLMGYDGEKGGIPRVVKDSIQFLRETGMQDDGLFRRSPAFVLLKAAQDAYDRGNVVSLETFGDPHVAAVLLKKYLRDLPEPIFPESLYPIIRRCPQPTNDPGDMSAVTFIREMLLPELPPCVYILLSNILHLMHEVSLRSASNRMDAHNLSIVLCPNLVSSSSPVRDVMMCAIPGGPALFPSPSSTSLPALSSANSLRSHTNSDSNTSPHVPSTPAAISEPKTTLGSVIKLCIQRYYEIFDEVRDRSEALPPSRPFHPQYTHTTDSSSAESSPVEGSPHRTPHDEAPQPNEEEEIDDAMLVMPIGPTARSGQTSPTTPQASPPSAWAAGSTAYKPRHRSTLSKGSSSGSPGGVRSMLTSADSGGLAYASMSRNKARSMISVESGGGMAGRKGSISIGRGTMRNSKAVGAGVEAIGITAEGFFAAPPPVKRVNSSGNGSGREGPVGS